MIAYGTRMIRATSRRPTDGSCGANASPAPSLTSSGAPVLASGGWKYGFGLIVEQSNRTVCVGHDAQLGGRIVRVRASEAALEAVDDRRALPRIRRRRDGCSLVRRARGAAEREDRDDEGR
jgi:hypothetical protein